MLFKPFTKGSGWFSYLLIIALHPITLVPVNDATFLSNQISFFGCHHEVFNGFASFEEYLNAIFLTSVFDTFTQAFDVWNTYIGSSFYGIGVASQSLVFCFWTVCEPLSSSLLCQGPFWVFTCCKGLFDVVLFFLQMLFGGTNFFCPMKQSTDDTVVCRDGMMAVPLKILISMGRFSIYSCWQWSIRLGDDHNI